MYWRSLQTCLWMKKYRFLPTKPFLRIGSMRHNLNTSQDDLVKSVRVATKHQLFQFNGHPYEQIDVNIAVVLALYN